MAVRLTGCKRWFLLVALTCGVARASTLSEEHMYAGDVESALRAAALEARQAPDDIAAQERHVDVLLTLGLTDRAIQVAKQRVEQQPMNPDSHYLLGRAVPSAEAARASFERALRLEPDHARSHMGMGAVYTAEADMDGAIEAYQRAVERDPGLAEAWLGLSRAWIVKNDLPSALAVSKRAMEAAPSAPDPYLTAAVLDPANARPTLEKAARLAGRDARIHASLAEVLLAAGEADGALASASRALAIDPTDAAALRAQMFARALKAGTLDVKGWRALIAAQADARGPAAFDPLVEAYPRSALALAGRSQARLAAGDAAGALADLQKAGVLDAGEPEIQGALGLLLLQQGKAADALPWIERAAAARPWDGSLGIARGAALGRVGRHDEAIAGLASLSTRRRYDSEVAIAHADALLLAGKPELAYKVVLDAAERRMDARLMVALMAVATQVGRFAEAADILEQIGRTTGDPKALELAARLRARQR